MKYKIVTLFSLSIVLSTTVVAMGQTVAVDTTTVSTTNSAQSAAQNTATVAAPQAEVTLESLTNYQVNNEHMVSSGLPSAAHFQLLKDEGISRVIDLIPGERGQEQLMVEALSLNYHNIQVEWEHPTLANFKEYTGYMAQANSADDKVLTHCKLNWRGAVFTYLYRITCLLYTSPSPRD